MPGYDPNAAASYLGDSANASSYGGQGGGSPGASQPGGGWQSMIPSLSRLLGGMGQYQQPQNAVGSQYGDTQTTQQRNLLPMGAAEAGLQQGTVGAYQNAQQAAGGPMPGQLSLQSILSGQLPPEMQQNIHQLAFGGIGQALQAASRQAQEQALSQGVPLSSIQFSNAAGLQAPLLQQAAQTQAGMSMQGSEQLMQLRNQYIGNLLALQQSPALDRLTQLRLAASPQTSTSVSRAPGGLPQNAYGPETSAQYLQRQQQSQQQQQQYAQAAQGGGGGGIMGMLAGLAPLLGLL